MRVCLEAGSIPRWIPLERNSRWCIYVLLFEVVLEVLAHLNLELLVEVMLFDVWVDLSHVVFELVVFFFHLSEDRAYACESIAKDNRAYEDDHNADKSFNVVALDHQNIKTYRNDIAIPDCESSNGAPIKTIDVSRHPALLHHVISNEPAACTVSWVFNLSFYKLKQNLLNPHIMPNASAHMVCKNQKGDQLAQI
jgi:hypothetical protein